MGGFLVSGCWVVYLGLVVPYDRLMVVGVPDLLQGYQVVVVLVFQPVWFLSWFLLYQDFLHYQIVVVVVFHLTRFLVCFLFLQGFWYNQGYQDFLQYQIVVVVVFHLARFLVCFLFPLGFWYNQGYQNLLDLFQSARFSIWIQLSCILVWVLASSSFLKLMVWG